MKKTIGYLALLVAVMMFFTACGTGGNSAANTTANTTEAAASTASTTAETTAAPVDQGPPTELTIAYLITGAQPADQALVEEELNKVITSKINVKVKLLPVNFGAAMQQYNLMLSSNEKLDLLLTFPFTYQNLAATGRIQEIGPLLDQYGQGIKDAVGPFLKGSLLNGKIYGVTPVSDKAGGGGLAIVKSVVDKYKIDLSKVQSYADIGSVLKTIKDNEPNAYPFTYSAQGIGLIDYAIGFNTDKLGDNFGVLMNYGQELKVVDYFESQEYADMVKLNREWYQKGYIMKNIATSKEDTGSLIKAGKAYVYLTPTKPGIDVQCTASTGVETVVQEYSKPFSTTSNITLFQWVVPTASKTPDKAVQMLNLMYTDSDVENLLSWGIEGKHYVKQADGTIGFPEGVSDKNSGWFMNQPWMMGNEFVAYVWTGNPPDTWEQTKKFNESATISKAMGFTYDPTPVKTEIAALTNVYNQYKQALESGSVDPDKILPQFIAKLKASGIDKVVAEKQKQLDAWAAANNVK